MLSIVVGGGDIPNRADVSKGADVLEVFMALIRCMVVVVLVLHI
jgi:hypothetical protein